MRIVTTMMTTKKIDDYYVKEALKILENQFGCKVEAFQFKYDDRQFFETDLDLFDVQVEKDTVFKTIDQLIVCYEKIINAIPMPIDFITANDDTEIEILKYENDTDDIKDFGMFVTNRKISCLKPYYSSNKCKAYVNLSCLGLNFDD